MSTKAVILLSGGLDSSTLAYVSHRKGYLLHALSFDYGQRHHRELRCARQIAERLGIEQTTVKIDLSGWSPTPLLGNCAVPVDRDETLRSAGVAPTYVPGRNTMFLAFALSLAESRDCSTILIGAHNDDHIGYPDCREEYFTAFEAMGTLGTRCGQEGTPIQIKRPFISWKKSWIVEAGIDAGLDYALTWTCYNGEGLACGRCDSCQQRLSAFALAGATDPLSYSSGALS